VTGPDLRVRAAGRLPPIWPPVRVKGYSGDGGFPWLSASPAAPVASTILAPGQYQLIRDDGSKSLVYGAGAGAIQVVDTSYSPGTMTVGDQQVVGHDGVLPGVDTQAGAVLSQDGIALVAPGLGYAALDAYDALSAIWNDPVIRLTSGRYQVLRMLYRGSLVTRRIYGRGRAITPVYGQVVSGAVPFTAQFQALDNNVYDDVTLSAVMQATPTVRPVSPIHPPTVMAPVLYGTTATLTVGGTVPTWPVITMAGYAVNPKLSFPGTAVTIGYTGSIAAGQLLTIDTRPWARTFMLGGASAAGGMNGSPMIALQLWPGTTTATYAVTSGASLCTISWNNAVQALGGSL
jgi:hypothetical protein